MTYNERIELRNLTRKYHEGTLSAFENVRFEALNNTAMSLQSKAMKVRKWFDLPIAERMWTHDITEIGG